MRFAAVLSLGCALALAASASGITSLAGAWQFRMDPEDRGVDEAWFHSDWPDRIHLPGAMAEAGYGYDVTAETDWTGSVVSRMWHEEDRFAPYRNPENTKILFWLQPDKHYVGAAWYQREIVVPDSYAGQHLALILERPHWETRLWIDGRYAGMQNSLSTPHVYNVTPWLEPGAHRITLRVDNRVTINVGPNAHSVSDNTQGNWNGVTGRMLLRAQPKARIEHIAVYPDLTAKIARLRVAIANDTGRPLEGVLELTALCNNVDGSHAPPAMTVPVAIAGPAATIAVDFVMGEGVRLWDEFSPALYALNAQLDAKTGAGATRHVYATRFGMREIAARGTQFTLNGKPLYLRGTLECCIFPKTGYPPTDVPEWRRILRAAQAHGLNHMRFHSWCPPKAAFIAADELGVLFQVECPAWAHIGDGKPIDRFIYAEGDRILEHYGNHPSFCFLAYGNEPAGGNQKAYLAELLEYWKAKDGRRLYTAASGWPQLPESQYHVWPAPRVHAWGQGLESRFNAEPFQSVTDYRDFVAKHDVPIVSHEIGQWCVFPNLEEIPKYTGYLKPKNFEIVRDLLANNHMLDQARAFLMASGKLQAIAYKEEIEAALRTPGFGGFQLLDLHDFPGQGTALVGVLDPFWEEKGYIAPAAFRRFCGPSVPLLRFEKCVWLANETFTAQAEITHYGPAPLEDAAPYWRIETDAGAVVAQGVLDASDVPRATAHPLGAVAAPFAQAPAPCKLRVVLGIEGLPIENTWDLWVYPPRVDTAAPPSVHVAATLDDAALDVLDGGGRVLLLPPPFTVKGDERGPVAMGFSPIFWNTFWTRGQPPHTLGILCDPTHPALADFPTESHSNWQWWDLIHHGQAMILDDLPPALRPIVQVIDDWNSCRRLGLLFEARVNGGKVLVCAADIAADLDARPVARQMRRSLLDYMASDAFDPAVEVSAGAVRGLFHDAPHLAAMGAKAQASSSQRGHWAQAAIDGNPATIWHTRWDGEIASYPHWLAVDLGQEHVITRVTLLPRQDMTNGRIGKYIVYVSSDGHEWGLPMARARAKPGKDPLEIALRRPSKARHVKIVAAEPLHANHPWASLAELDIIVEE